MTLKYWKKECINNALALTINSPLAIFNTRITNCADAQSVSGFVVCIYVTRC